MDTEENIPYWLKNTNSAVNNMKKNKNKNIQIGTNYKIVIYHQTNEFNEYFISAFGFKDMLMRLSNIVEPSLDIDKCKIEIEEIL